MSQSEPASGSALLDEIRAQQRGSGTTCHTGVFIENLTPEQRAAITAAQAEGITLAAIGRWLQKLGNRASAEAAGRHLAARCKCQTR